MANQQQTRIAVIGLGETGKRVVEAVLAGSDASGRLQPLVIAAQERGTLRLCVSSTERSLGLDLPGAVWTRATAVAYLRSQANLLQAELKHTLSGGVSRAIIIASLAEPWAAGLVDLAGWLRRLRQRPRLPLAALLSLRTGGAEAAGERAVAYAALKELQYFQDGRLAPADQAIGGRSGSIRPAPGRGLFDRIQLLTDAGDPTLPLCDSAAGVAAIAQEIRLALSGDESLFHPATVALAEVKCDPRRAVYGVISGASLRLPRRELGEYCALRGTAAVIERLVGLERENADDRREDDDFLVSLDIGSPGGAARLAETLLQNAADTGSAVAGLLTAAAAEDRPKRRMEQLATEEAELRRHVLPQVEAAVKANGERELAVRLSAIREWTHYVIVNRGLRAATSVLKRCESGGMATLDALEQECEGWERCRRGIEEQMASCWNEYRNQSGLAALLGRKRRAELEQQLTQHHDALVREESLDLARREALALVSALIEYGGALQETIAQISDKLRRISDRLRSARELVSIPADSVLDAAGFDTIFARFFPGPQALIERLLAEHDDLLDYLTSTGDGDLEAAITREAGCDFTASLGGLGVFELGLPGMGGPEAGTLLDGLLRRCQARLDGVPEHGAETIRLLTAGVTGPTGERLPESEAGEWVSQHAAAYFGGGRGDEVILSVSRNGLRPACIPAALAGRSDYLVVGDEVHVVPNYRELPDLGVPLGIGGAAKRGRKNARTARSVS